MKKFEVKIIERKLYTYEVEADNQKEAEKKVLSGNVACVHIDEVDEEVEVTEIEPEEKLDAVKILDDFFASIRGGKYEL